MTTDFVSLITCTYNRRRFYNNLKTMIAYQDYPHSHMEWIIMDDSDESSEAMFPEKLDGITVRYIYLKKKIPLGKKRDLLNHAAKGKYLINIDDDDFYPPCRVSHAVAELKRSGSPIAGSSKMFMYFCKDNNIYQLGPYKENHGTAATMAYTKEYANEHFYYDSSNGNYAEEAAFTEGWKPTMVQLDPMKTVLALSHTDNTIEKTMFLDERYGQVGRTIHKVTLCLEDFISTPDVLEFYKNLSLSYEFKVNDISKQVSSLMESNMIQSQETYNQEMAKRMVAEIQHAYIWEQKMKAMNLMDLMF